MPRAVTVARRPPGWVAPGPPPAGSQGRAELEPGPDEDLSYLAGDWRLFQKKRGHRWSLDDLLTAHVAAEEAEALGADRLLDLGCGQGTVLLLLAWRFPRARLWGIEAQADRAELARRSIAYDGVADRAEVVTGDFRELAALGPRDFSVVTGTPPYFPRGTGPESVQPHAGPCRFEHRGGVEAYLDAAVERLAPGGRLVLCNAALMGPRVDHAVARRGYTLLRRVEVVPREGKAPLLVVDVLALGPSGAAPRLEPLVVRDQALEWTPAFRQVRASFGMPTRPP